MNLGWDKKKKTTTTIIITTTYKYLRHPSTKAQTKPETTTTTKLCKLHTCKCVCVHVVEGDYAAWLSSATAKKKTKQQQYNKQCK